MPDQMNLALDANIELITGTDEHGTPHLLIRVNHGNMTEDFTITAPGMSIDVSAMSPGQGIALIT